MKCEESQKRRKKLKRKGQKRKRKSQIYVKNRGNDEIIMGIKLARKKKKRQLEGVKE